MSRVQATAHGIWPIIGVVCRGVLPTNRLSPPSLLTSVHLHQRILTAVSVSSDCVSAERTLTISRARLADDNASQLRPALGHVFPQFEGFPSAETSKLPAAFSASFLQRNITYNTLRNQHTTQDEQNLPQKRRHSMAFVRTLYQADQIKVPKERPNKTKENHRKNFIASGYTVPSSYTA